MAELVRQAIRSRRDAQAASMEQLLEDTRGLWKQGDGLEFQIRMRLEWDRKAARFAARSEKDLPANWHA